MCAAHTLWIWPLLVMSFEIAEHIYVQFSGNIGYYTSTQAISSMEKQKQLHFVSTAPFYALYSLSLRAFTRYCKALIWGHTVPRLVILRRITRICVKTWNLARTLIIKWLGRNEAKWSTTYTEMKFPWTNEYISYIEIRIKRIEYYCSKFMFLGWQEFRLSIFRKII